MLFYEEKIKMSDEETILLSSTVKSVIRKSAQKYADTNLVCCIPVSLVPLKSACSPHWCEAWCV